MTLNKQYSIATRQQRSTRIDSDLSSEFFQGLVYHGTAQSSLETLFRQYSQTGQQAYTLTGPYGSGKSTIALLLTGLLHENSELRESALNAINDESKKLLSASLPYNKGWLQIRAVGGVHGPIETFWSATMVALLEHPSTTELHHKYHKVNISSESHLIEVWEALFEEVENLVDGVIILADEMGKSLEFINKNRGELHLFQDLAEVLSRIDTPVIFLGLLHQAFSEYAKDRGTKLQEEWAKIQGRYNDILYNVSTDETVALIGKSINHAESIDNSGDRIVEQVLEALGNEESDRKKQLKQRLEQCIPLHPLTALMLGPISKRRFSQNERSTFSFLNSHEQNSFQMFLKENVNRDSRYTLKNLWDYLEVNLEHAILGSPDGHGWAAATESIRQATKKQVPEKAIEILKAIALITLFGKPANLYATEDMLLAASGINDKEELDEYLLGLKNASCVIYRKHLSSWVVFEGSDLDIPSLIEEKIEQQGSSKEAINHIVFSNQIIAKGYYHRVGTLRWAEQSISHHFDNDFAEQLITQRKGEFANMVLLLNQTDETKLREVSKQHPTLILANAKSSDEIIALAKELYALELIKSDKEIGATLQHDNVAQKEYSGRLTNAEIALNGAIAEAFSNADWYCLGQKSKANTLSAIVSDTADKVFNATPVVMNELVNRNKLSGTAVSALKKLLEAMLDQEDEENLGITGHPPEMSMYISCLKNTAIHTPEAENDRHWHHDANIDPKLKALFDAASNYLVDNAGRNVRLSEIVALWNKAPYGITQGVTPIFLLAFLKSLGHNIAFYEKDLGGEYAFIAEPDVDYVHKLIKSPQDLAVKYIVLDKKEQDWLHFLASFTAAQTNRNVTNNILSVASPLVTTMHNLPNWVKNAHNFDADLNENKKIIAVRDLFLQANDPHALLIVDLPKYLDPEGEYTFTQKIDVLERHFKVLRSKHELMLKSIKQKVKSLFPESGEELTSMCQLVEHKAGDIRLKAFARELGKSEDGLLEWLESMIQIVVGRGKQSWNEGLLLTASTKISEFAQDFLSVVKSSDTTQNKHVADVKTKLVSLVLEDNDGQLKSYKKEVRIIKQDKADKKVKDVERTLTELEMDEFERIHVLQTLLKQALEAQG
ncbi:hypothetical protein J4N45_13315 [Vibrio sp. SCSIO 43140]|uniref:hypothetical protein n=1 Tax=Vibrio sp. SCSIO 43140 TaxID=2819100 RepID=UPI00207651CB|nr:hypothetical protein [Vibrio sp. SCSIO 43140]USD59493.1 hypothetical protein J4N45_13315 [Vibrio sp. SCSIO 43140]